MEKNVRIHRIGTISFGCILIVFGGLFLAHIFFPMISYAFIFHLWPVVLIMLGIEVLAGNSWTRREAKGEKIRFEYDIAAVFLMAGLTFFAMIMAAVELSLSRELL